MIALEATTTDCGYSELENHAFEPKQHRGQTNKIATQNKMNTFFGQFAKKKQECLI